MAPIVTTAFQCCVSAVCALAIVENALAIAVFAGTRKLRVKYYAFVFNLALADLVMAPAAMASTWSRTAVSSVLVNAAFAVSVLTILATAVNRYLALRLAPPARYDAQVTARRLVGVCVTLWCLGLGYSLLVSDKVIKASLDRAQFLGFALAVSAVWLVTALVYLLAFRRVRQYTAPLASAEGTRANADQTRVRQTRRLLVVFVLILVTAFVSWLPISVYRTIRFASPSVGRSGAMEVYSWASRLLYTLSAAVNPVIYWWRLDDFREGFRARFCRCVREDERCGAEAGQTDELRTFVETGL